MRVKCRLKPAARLSKYAKIVAKSAKVAAMFENSALADIKFVVIRNNLLIFANIN